MKPTVRSELVDAAAAEAVERDGHVVWSGAPHVEAYLARGAVRRNRARREGRLVRTRSVRMMGLAFVVATLAAVALFGITGRALLPAGFALALACWLVREAEWAQWRGQVRECLMSGDAYAVSGAAFYVATHAEKGFAQVVRHDFGAVEAVSLKMRDGGSGDVDVTVGGRLVRLHALPEARLVSESIRAHGGGVSRSRRRLAEA